MSSALKCERLGWQDRARQSKTEQGKLFKTNHHSAFYYTANYTLIYPINYMLEISENKGLVIFLMVRLFRD